jgi:hypothetical protein
VSDLRCHGCGVELTPRGPGRLPKWCSQRCRKQTLYTGTCRLCGGKTGWSGQKTPREICAPCAHQRQHDERHFNRDHVLERLADLELTLGRPFLFTDLNPWSLKHAERREARVALKHEHDWPSVDQVVREFGSASAARQALAEFHRQGLAAA